jgi:F0F1-type ATP synthase epsilon subunit
MRKMMRLWRRRNDEYDSSDSGEDDEDTDQDIDVEDHVRLHGAPESIVLPLPSHLGVNKNQDQMITALTEDELIVRKSQASDSLQDLRLSLGMKSAIFRKMVSNAKSQKKKTRAWRAVHVATAAVQRHARSYRLAQHALVQLNADPSILTKFPPLEKDHLTVSRDVVEENRIGQRSEHVSWIWRLDLGNDQDKNDVFTCQLYGQVCIHVSIPG